MPDGCASSICPEVAPKDIVVVGGSAGAVQSARALLGSLPAQFSATILIALHRAPLAPGNLATVLSRAARLPVVEPIGRSPLESGRIYLAAADHHLLVEPNVVRGARGPHEHRHRPAIDPLFRSAAIAYGPRVVAVLLSGTGTDGTIGLWYVRDRGGLTVVQEDAPFRAMPEHGARVVGVQHVLPVEAISRVLADLTEGAYRELRRSNQPAHEDEA
jgi:two-component system chemotaxis response regulator CheB